MHGNIVGQKRDNIKTAHLPMWTLMHKIKEWTIKSFLELYKVRLLMRMLLSNSIHHSTWHLHRVYSRVSDDRIFAIQGKNSLRNLCICGEWGGEVIWNVWQSTSELWPRLSVLSGSDLEIALIWGQNMAKTWTRGPWTPTLDRVHGLFL